MSETSSADLVVARNTLASQLAQSDFVGAVHTIQSVSTHPLRDKTLFAGLSLQENLNIFRTGAACSYNFAVGFVCCVCRLQLERPVVFLCGHAACRVCAAQRVFTRTKCPQCDIVCSLPRGYQPDVVLRVLEKQRPRELTRTDKTPADAALDAALALIGSWLGSRTLNAEAPFAVVQLASGVRLQLQLTLERPQWALLLWFIFDAPQMTPLQLALATTTLTYEACQNAILRRLHASVTAHKSPQRVTVELAFTNNNTLADTIRLDFHAAHTWAAQQWEKVVDRGH